MGDGILGIILVPESQHFIGRDLALGNLSSIQSQCDMAIESWAESAIFTRCREIEFDLVTVDISSVDDFVGE